MVPKLISRSSVHSVASWPMPDALKLAEEHKPDLILLDMLAPKLSGPELLETP